MPGRRAPAAAAPAPEAAPAAPAGGAHLGLGGDGGALLPARRLAALHLHLLHRRLLGQQLDHLALAVRVDHLDALQESGCAGGARSAWRLARGAQGRQGGGGGQRTPAAAEQGRSSAPEAARALTVTPLRMRTAFFLCALVTPLDACFCFFFSWPFLIFSSCSFSPADGRGVGWVVRRRPARARGWALRHFRRAGAMHTARRGQGERRPHVGRRARARRALSSCSSWRTCFGSWLAGVGCRRSCRGAAGAASSCSGGPLGGYVLNDLRDAAPVLAGEATRAGHTKMAAGEGAVLEEYARGWHPSALWGSTVFCGPIAAAPPLRRCTDDACLPSFQSGNASEATQHAFTPPDAFARPAQPLPLRPPRRPAATTASAPGPLPSPPLLDVDAGTGGLFVGRARNSAALAPLAAAIRAPPQQLPGRGASRCAAPAASNTCVGAIAEPHAPAAAGPRGQMP
jgi:hypothetical protein